MQIRTEECVSDGVFLLVPTELKNQGTSAGTSESLRELQVRSAINCANFLTWKAEVYRNDASESTIQATTIFVFNLLLTVSLSENLGCAHITGGYL